MKTNSRKISIGSFSTTLPLVTLLTLALFTSPTSGNAATLNFGSSSSVLTLDMSALGSATPINTLDALFDNSTPGANLLVDPGLHFTLPNIGMAVNPATVVSPAGRTLQNTTLDVDPLNVSATWGAATSDVGVFVSGGEQIGFEGMLRFTGSFPGSLLSGDFALRYSPSRVGVVRGGGTLSGFVLTSNIDFANVAFADIANATITPGSSSFSISGDLLVSDGLSYLVSSGLGADFGSFSLTAAVVPEPSAASLLLVFALVGLCCMRARGIRARVCWKAR